MRTRRRERWLQKQRLRRKEARKPKLVQAQIPRLELSDRLTLALAMGDGPPRKFAALFFKNKSADLYLATPYLAVDEYRCGTFEGHGGQTTWTNTADAIAPSRRQVKLSYHESGQVHLRVQDNEGQRILARIQAPRLDALRGNHIFTLELEGAEHFDEAKLRDQRNNALVAIHVDEPYWRVKIVGYAGQTAQEVHKYGANPTCRRRDKTDPVWPR